MNNMCRCYQKSSLSAWTDSKQTLDKDCALFFTDCKITGESIKFSKCSNSGITITKPGMYMLSISADGAMDDQNGDIVIQLTKNGEVVPGVKSASNSAHATYSETLSFSKIIIVGQNEKCPPEFKIMNTGIKTVYTNLLLNIVKLA